MEITIILVIMLVVCIIVSARKNYNGICSFDRITTKPLRGLLALLIVSHHLGQRTDIYPISQFTSGLGVPIVAIFFFLSGYGLGISYVNKNRAYLDGFLQKRLHKLLPELIVLSVVMLIFYYFYYLKDSAFLINKMRNGWVPLPNSWFIYAIIYIYFTFYLCAKVCSSAKVIGVLFIFAILFYIWITSAIIHFPSYWFISIITINLGYFVAIYEKNITRLWDYKVGLFTALIALLSLSVLIMTEASCPLVCLIFKEIWMLILSISVYVIVRTLGFINWKWLCEIGSFSLELYLIHGIPLAIGYKLDLQNWSLWIFTYILSIPLAILLYRAFGSIFGRKKLIET